MSRTANGSSRRPWSLHHGDGVDGLISHGPVDHTIWSSPVLRIAAMPVAVAQSMLGDLANDELRNRMARAVAMQTRRWALVFCSFEEAHLWRFALVAAGMSYWRTGVWVQLGSAHKSVDAGPSDGAEAIVIAHSRALTQRWNGASKPAVWYAALVKANPSEKPPASLLREIVADFTDEGELVADPCCRSGTTGVAAVGLGRRFVGWEIDEEIHDATLGRLKLPLFDRPLVQTTLPTEPKSSRARARVQIDRAILDAVYNANEGLRISELSELVDKTPRELRTALKRLQKAGAVVRQGKTSQTRWYYAPQQEQS